MPPGRVLKDDAVAVGVLEGDTALVPVGVVRRHRRVALGLHALDRSLPRRWIENVNYPGASAGASPVIEPRLRVAGLTSSRGRFDCP